MGTIINPLGKLSGKIGDFIYSQRNGKTVISRRPLTYSKTKDPKVLARRKRFALSAHFCGCMNKCGLLKQIWRNSDYTKKKTPYNMMLKENYAYVGEEDIYKNPRITPDFGNADLKIKNFSFNEASLSVILNPIDMEKDFSCDCIDPKYLQMAAIWKSTIEYGSSNKSFCFDLLESDKVKIVQGEEMNFYYDLYGFKSQNVLDNFNHRLFILFILLDSELKPVGYSNTYDVDVDCIPFNKNMSEEL